MYNDRILPLLRQFLHIPNRITKFMDLTANFPTSCFNQLFSGLINAWCFFSFSVGISTSKALGSGTSGSAVCISLCLT